MSESLTSRNDFKKPALRGRELIIEERAKEIDDLREQKLQLIRQIRKLKESIFLLEEKKEETKEAVKEITSERLETLNRTAKKVASQLEADAEVLRKKSKKLDKRDVL